MSSCWPADIRLFEFYRKRRLGPNQSHYNQSRLWSRLQTTLVQIRRITPKRIYTEYTALKFFSPFRIFEQFALALKFFTVLNIFFTIQDFWAICACPEKQSVPWVHWIEYVFYHSGILSNLLFVQFVFAPQHETSCDSEITTKENFDHWRK